MLNTINRHFDKSAAGIALNKLAKAEFILGLACLIFGSLGFLFHLSGFTPTGIVFLALGLVLILIVVISRRRGYPGPPRTTLFATAKIGQEEKHLLQVDVRSGYSYYRDLVSILVDGKEEVSSGWALGRRREYDLSVGEKEKHLVKVKLRRGPARWKYEFSADGTLIGEGKLQPAGQAAPTA